MGSPEANRLVEKLGLDLYRSDPLVHHVITAVLHGSISEDDALVMLVKALLKIRDDLSTRLLVEERNKVNVRPILVCGCGKLKSN